MSTSYERVNFITSFGFSLRWRRQFVEKSPPSEDNVQVIDLMTGMGESWHAIKKHYPNARITALDFSEGMLHHCRAKNKNKFQNAIHVIEQDMLNNSLQTDHFDRVFCSFGLKTFSPEQLQLFANEVARILKPGGEFTFIEVSIPNNILLKTLYRFYLRNIIPIFGRLLLGNPREYRMLSAYTDKFVNAEIAKSAFQKAGLYTEYDSYFFGCATGIHGYK